MPAEARLAIKSRRGSSAMPACVFVPGLGMDSAIWAAPSEARLLGGLFPLGKIYRDQRLRTLYHDMAELGYTVATWSQRRPVGPIKEVLEELYAVVEHAMAIENSGIILIGHSRGGLAARVAAKELLGEGVPLRALVTIAGPHHGSSMARWATFLAPFAEFVDRFIPKKEKKTFSNSIKKTLGFLASRGVRELLPDSELIGSLSEKRPGKLYCLSAGGTNPALIEINGYLKIPGTFQKVLPAGMLPDEMVVGRGDCLVTDESSALPFADEHLSFHKNHLRIILDKDARDEILKRIEKIT